jgi:uncharacterized membrane protein
MYTWILYLLLSVLFLCLSRFLQKVSLDSWDLFYLSLSLVFLLVYFVAVGFGPEK